MVHFVGGLFIAVDLYTFGALMILSSRRTVWLIQSPTLCLTDVLK